MSKQVPLAVTWTCAAVRRTGTARRLQRPYQCQRVARPLLPERRHVLVRVHAQLNVVVVAQDRVHQLLQLLGVLGLNARVLGRPGAGKQAGVWREAPHGCCTIASCMQPSASLCAVVALVLVPVTLRQVR